MLGRRLADRVQECGGYVHGHRFNGEQNEHENIKFTSGDLTESDVASKVVAQFNAIDRKQAVVFHGAAISDDNVCEIDPKRAMDVNVHMVSILLEALNGKPISRIIFPSTAYVYGTQHTEAIEESVPMMPQSIYPMTKMMAEALIAGAAEEGSLCADIIRISNVYSEDVKAGTVLEAVVSQLGNQTIAMKNLLPVRDFIHVDDVIETILRLSIRPVHPGVEIYNVSTSKDAYERKM